MLLDQLRSEPYFVRGLLRENETRFAVPRSTLLRTSSGRAHGIRVIRAIRGEVISAFPRRAFGKQDRYAKGPKSGRALTVPA